MKKSAGIICFRRTTSEPEIFLVHPGGPFWKNKDEGAWSIPKGELDDDEEPLKAAQREFFEEVGISISGSFIELNPVKQKGGKMVYAWALETDIDIEKIKSNIFEMEWPPRSNNLQQFPEIDKGAWFSIAMARQKINPAQMGFIEQVLNILT